MDSFENQASKDGFSMKLWRGERMCLIGFDVTHPEPDFVGFAIECRSPGDTEFNPLLNRIAFSYDTPTTTAVTGARKFPSTEAPFQNFAGYIFPTIPNLAPILTVGQRCICRRMGFLRKVVLLN